MSLEWSWLGYRGLGRRSQVWRFASDLGAGCWMSALVCPHGTDLPPVICTRLYGRRNAATGVRSPVWRHAGLRAARCLARDLAATVVSLTRSSPTSALNCDCSPHAQLCRHPKGTSIAGEYGHSPHLVQRGYADPGSWLTFPLAWLGPALKATDGQSPAASILACVS